jgi:hypothetical protein
MAAFPSLLALVEIWENLYQSIQLLLILSRLDLEKLSQEMKIEYQKYGSLDIE